MTEDRISMIQHGRDLDRLAATLHEESTTLASDLEAILRFELEAKEQVLEDNRMPGTDGYFHCGPELDDVTQEVVMRERSVVERLATILSRHAKEALALTLAESAVECIRNNLEHRERNEPAKTKTHPQELKLKL